MTRIKIIQGDITEQVVDVIVNAANKECLGGAGVDGAIHAVAGPGLFKECLSLGGCETGEAKITGGYDLPAKHVIHTVGPIYGKEDGREAELLADCYRSSLKLAKERGLRSVAFPAISTGAFGYPKEEAAEIAVAAVRKFIAENPEAFDEILFVLYDEESYEIYTKF